MKCIQALLGFTLCLVVTQPASSDSISRVSEQFAITLEPNESIRLTWPSALGNDGVDSADTLDEHANWQPVTAVPLLQQDHYILEFPASDRVRFFRLRLVTPVIDAVLAQDTGVSRSDRLTSSPTVLGTLFNQGTVTAFLAGFDEAEPAAFFDALPYLGEGGHFYFDEEALLRFAGGSLADGEHTLHLLAIATGGSECVFDLTFVQDATPPEARLSPAPGDAGALPNQIVEAAFSEPVFIGTLDAGGEFQPSSAADLIGLSLLKEPVAGRAFFDAKGARLSFVPSTPLASASAYRVAVDSARIIDAAGNTANVGVGYTFRTSGGLGIPGTSVSGSVFDSAPGAGNADLPLAGARVSLVSDPSNNVSTDAQGRFQLDDVPAGKLMVEVDGRTVATALGTFYPTVTELIEIVPGRTNTFRSPIYLPLAREADFAVIDNRSGASTAVANTTQLPGWSLSVPAGAVQKRDGTIAGRILIAPVEPSRLPAPLPAGFNPAIVITVQSEGGADVFTQPVPLAAPNLEGLQPGTKTVLWDFDHARGEFVPAATMTVSADGLTVSTDPGQGVVRPGWHLVGSQLRFGFRASDIVDHNNCGEELTDAQREEIARKLNDALLSLAKAISEAIGALPISIPANIGATAAGGLIGGMRDSIGVSGNPAGAVDAFGNFAGDVGMTALGASALSAAASQAVAQGQSVSRDVVRNALRGDPAAQAALSDALGSMKNAPALMNSLGKLGNLAGRINSIASAISALADYKRYMEDIASACALLKDPPGDAVSKFIAALEEGSDGPLEGLADAAEAQLRDGIGLLLATEMLTLTPNWPSDSAGLTPTLRGEITRIANEFDANAVMLERSVGRALVVGPLALEKLASMRDTLAPPPDGTVFYKAELANGAVIRGTSLGSELFTVDVPIPTGAEVLRVTAATAAGRVGSVRVTVPTAPPSSGIIEAPVIFMTRSKAVDANANGFADDIEDVISAASLTPAQAADLLTGVSPAAAGLDVSGVVSRLPLNSGSVLDLAADGNTVFVANSNGRVQVADYSDPMRPALIAQINLGGLPARVSAGGGLLAVSFSSRVKVYEISDPASPRLESEFANGASAVLAGGWLVFDRAGTVEVRDPLGAGESRGSQVLPGSGPVLDLYHTGGVVYALRGNSALSLVSMSLSDAGELALLDSVPLTAQSIQGFNPRLSGSGGEVVLAGVAMAGLPGLLPIDADDPSNLRPGTLGAQGSAAAASDGAGNIIAARSGAAPPDVAVFASPSDAAPSAMVQLASAGDDLVMVNGYAIISASAEVGARGSGCLDAVRLPGTDVAGNAPSIVIVSPPAGTEFVEGQAYSILIEAFDDVRMARVELYLQGTNLVTSDGSYPFDLTFVPPSGLPNTPITLTARAIDTAGNASSASIVGSYRAVAPRILSADPAPGSALQGNLTTLSLHFDEVIDREPPPDRSAFAIVSTDGVAAPVLAVGFDIVGRAAQLALGRRLEPGDYSLTLGEGALLDRGGLALDGEFSGTFPSGDGQAGGVFRMEFTVLPPPPIKVDTFPFQILGGWSLGVEAPNFLSSSPYIVSDFNGDGRGDFAVTRFDSRPEQTELNLVEISLQNVGGTLGSALPLTTGPEPVQVAAGDVDGDGDVDLVTLNWDAPDFRNRLRKPYSFSILSGNGDGSFEAERRIETGRTMAEPGRLRVADFTGDGLADIGLLVPEFHDGGFDDLDPDPAEVLIFASTGGGAFAAPAETLLPYPRAFSGERVHFVVGEFNGDGRLDAIINGFSFVGSPADTQGRVLLGRGDGTFDELVSETFGQRGREWRLHAADLDGDGLDDAVFGNKVYRSVGDGTFAEVANPGLSALESSGSTSQIVGDFNGDDRIDLIARVTFANGNGLMLLVGNGDGSFTEAARLFINGPRDPGQLALADLNEDGLPDLLMPARGGPGYIALFNAPGGFTDLPFTAGANELTLRSAVVSDGVFQQVADFNGDGRDDLIGAIGFSEVGLIASGPGGGFTALRRFPLPADFSIRVQWPGDADGDGNLDLLVGDPDINRRIFYFPGDGVGGLGAAVEVAGGGALIGFDDLTGDGLPDIIVSGTSPSPGIYLGVRVNQGGSFGQMVNSRVSATSSGQLRAAFTADFGGDGLPDLAVAPGVGGSVMINRGAGRFEFMDSTLGNFRLTAVGDFTGDGFVDLLTRTNGFTDSQLQVWPGEVGGTLSEPLPARSTELAGTEGIFVRDFNGDGVLDLLGRNFHADPEAKLSFGDGRGGFGPVVRFGSSLSGFEGGAAVIAGDFTGDGLSDILIGSTVLEQKR